ncbi:MAG TPA: NADH-ubiquinone oxidoreductase-F iron-sulfur binding region domain-containing protein [Acidimicrobiales bacterium]|nr:NADH-ubiquinone oxidoreductase-F iron-sulfur binding region domain-containing protein [Acidimicrobiales bacterium]
MPSAGFLLPDEPVTSLSDYRDLGGCRGLARAQEQGPELTIKEVRLAKLRGRGGGGFPTGQKWAAVREASGRHHYAVGNAAEGEPATFKDRAILRANPYQVVEGVAIAALAVGAREAFVGIKASFGPEREALTRAVQEMGAAGVLPGLTIAIAAGPDEYLFGEEKAMLEVIEGNDPLPRLLPPFLHGLFATAPQLGWEAHVPETGHVVGHETNPTLVNNCETLANVPHILARGAEWFRSLGTEESPGTIVCTIVGDVARPTVVELEMGTPLSGLIERGGGPLPGRTLKAAFSGVANAVVRARDFGTPLTYEDMSGIGSGLGAAGFAVYDDTACMVEVARAFSRFLAVESCGQCPPCKLGSGQITAVLERLQAGRATEADVGRMGGSLRSVTDSNRCYLAVEEQVLVSSILQAFPEEVVAHLEAPCPLPRPILVPKVVSLEADQVVYDERQARKRPDWTYQDEPAARTG